MSYNLYPYVETDTYASYNKVIIFQDKLYAYCDDSLYTYTDNNCTWEKMTFNAWPDQIIITESGSLKLNLPSDSLEEGQYIGDPVEEITNTCICPSETLFSAGCKCGGD